MVFKKTSGTLPSMIIEVCKEHHLGLAKRTMMAKQYATPLFHVVIAASAHLFPCNLCGKYALHVDSELPTQLRLSSDDDMMMSSDNNLITGIRLIKMSCFN
jgi:hypothetical protein